MLPVFRVDQRTQAFQRLALDLTHAFACQPQLAGNFRKGLSTVIIEAVATLEYQPLARGKLTDPGADATAGRFIDRCRRCAFHNQLFDQSPIVVIR